MKARFVLACACLVQAAAFAGPRTPITEFFAKHVDTSVPALADIPARMAAGDVVGAEKLFAAHVRATLRHDALNGDWKVHRGDRPRKGTPDVEVAAEWYQHHPAIGAEP